MQPPNVAKNDLHLMKFFNQPMILGFSQNAIVEPMRPPKKCVTVGNGTNLIYCKDLGEYSDPIDYSDISQFYWRYLTL